MWRAPKWNTFCSGWIYHFGCNLNGFSNTLKMNMSMKYLHLKLLHAIRLKFGFDIDDIHFACMKININIIERIFSIGIYKATKKRRIDIFENRQAVKSVQNSINGEKRVKSIHIIFDTLKSITDHKCKSKKCRNNFFA